MKTPEKIYLRPRLTEEGESIARRCFLNKDAEHTIEYVRTDAFIEKACEGIGHLLSGYIIRNFHFGDSYEMDSLIEDFKNYMEGE